MMKQHYDERQRGGFLGWFDALVQPTEERREKAVADELLFEEARARFDAMFAHARANHVSAFDPVQAAHHARYSNPASIVDYVRPIVRSHVEMVERLVESAAFPVLNRRLRKLREEVAKAAMRQLNRDVFAGHDLRYLELNAVGDIDFEDVYPRRYAVGGRELTEYIGKRSRHSYMHRPHF